MRRWTAAGRAAPHLDTPAADGDEQEPRAHPGTRASSSHLREAGLRRARRALEEESWDEVIASTARRRWPHREGRRDAITLEPRGVRAGQPPPEQDSAGSVGPRRRPRAVPRVRRAEAQPARAATAGGARGVARHAGHGRGLAGRQPQVEGVARDDGVRTRRMMAAVTRTLILPSSLLPRPAYLDLAGALATSAGRPVGRARWTWRRRCRASRGVRSRCSAHSAPPPPPSRSTWW